MPDRNTNEYKLSELSELSTSTINTRTNIISQKDNDGQYYKELSMRAPKTKAWGSQKDGKHYKTMPIQPMEYSMANKLNALQHTIIKYVSRYPDKNGIADLGKAKHCVQMLIDWETNNKSL